MQFEAKYISKTYPDEGDNPAFTKGTKVHKQLEDYINFKKGLIDEPKIGKIASSITSIIDMYIERFGVNSVFAEQQVALDHEWKKTEWFGQPDVVKFRGIIDMIVFKTTESLSVIDFKTGKFRPYDEDYGQLHLTATFLFELYPGINEIQAIYLFAEHKKKIIVTFDRTTHVATKAKFDVEYIEINEDTEFEPSKNQYCFFCGIKDDCKYG